MDFINIFVCYIMDFNGMKTFANELSTRTRMSEPAGGFSHCDNVGHLLKKVTHEDGSTSTHCMRTVHAEQNAICQAARLGISLEGGTCYCRMTPCRTCAMLLINCGIERVVCEKKYHAGRESEEMFRQAGVSIEYFQDEVLRYDKQKGDDYF